MQAPDFEHPYGTGVWRLTDCTVTDAVRGDGSAVPDDLLLSMTLADADGQAALRSNFAVAFFTDLGKRRHLDLAG